MQNSRKHWKSLPSAGSTDILKGPFRCWLSVVVSTLNCSCPIKSVCSERIIAPMRPLPTALPYSWQNSTFVWMTPNQGGTEDLKRFLWIFVFWSQFSTSSLFGHALQGQIPIDTLTSKNCAVEKKSKICSTLATLRVPNIVVHGCAPTDLVFLT